MTLNLSNAREHFDNLVWSLAKGEPVASDGSGSPALAPREICKALLVSNHITPSSAEFDDLNEMLEAIDALPSMRTYGSYAKAVLKLLEHNENSEATMQSSEIDEALSTPATDLNGIAAKLDLLIAEHEAERDVVVHRGLAALKADIARLNS